jgi:hypothetical protein
MPTQQGQNQQLFSAMGQLTQAIQQLDQHTQDSDQAAQQRVQQMALNQTVQQQSQVAGISPSGVVLPSGTSDDALAALTALNQASVATAQQQTVSRGASESTPPGSSADLENQNEQQQATEQAMAYSLLGPEGGPAGAYYRKNYSIQRNLAWASGITNQVQTSLTNYANDENGAAIPAALAGGMSSALTPMNKALQWAQTSNTGKIGSLAIGAGIPAGINVANSWLALGQELGYTQQGTPRALLGMNIGAVSNHTATAEGAALNREANDLSGRSITNFLHGQLLGQLTHPEAQEAVGTLAAQGFSTSPFGQNGQGIFNSINGTNPNNTNMAIASNLLTPLMQGGLSAQDAAQWTPMLRNAGASVSSLMDTLSNLGTMAQQVRVPVAQMNAELEAVSQADMGQGAMPGTGLAAGQDFQAATGLQAQNMAQFFGSPMYQALASFQNGVNPLQVGGLSAGSQTQAALSTVQLLASISGGLGKGRNQYQTVGGVRMLKQSGSAENIAMVQQLLQQQGINMNPQDVARMMSEGQHMNQVTGLEGILGTQGNSYASGTGLYDPNLSPAARAKAWSKGVAPQLQSLESEGILSQSQLKKINSAKTTVGSGSKSQLLMQALEQGQQQSAQNQIQVNVQVGFTGSAKGVLKQTGKATSQVSLAQSIQNSGGSAMNNFLNNPYGDAASANDAMTNLFNGSNNVFDSTNNVFSNGG